MEVDQPMQYGGGDVSSTPSSAFEHFLGSPMSWRASSRISSVLGTPMSWRASSWGGRDQSTGDFSSTHQQHITTSIAPKAIDEESVLLQSGKYTCCGLNMHDIQALFAHYDEVHDHVSEPERDEEAVASQRHATRLLSDPDTHTEVDHESMELDLEGDISSNTPKSFVHKLFADAKFNEAKRYERAPQAIEYKPFRCPKQNCSRSYRTASGLKYHVMHGTCSDVQPKDRLEHIKELLAHKRQMVKPATGPPFGEQGSNLPTQADTAHSYVGAMNSSISQAQPFTAGISLFSVLSLTTADLEHVSEQDLVEVERQVEHQRPFRCCVGNCTRRYRNMNGLKYHYRTSGDHGQVGLLLLESGKHPHVEQYSASSNHNDSHIVQSRNLLGKGRLDEVTTIEPEDLTGKVVKRSQYAAHGGSYADIFTGDYQRDSSSSKHKVAIKVLRTHIYTEANKAKMQKRLIREIRVWTRLDHPHVLPLLGITRDFASELAMICPWMDEGDLAGYLEVSKNTLSTGKRLRICEDVVDGLCYVHSQNVIHGDLTTGNVLMHGGRAKLSDFGLSNVVAELRGASFQTSKAGGSARWAAPELFSADEETINLTFQADVYSLGGVIFHVMSGKVPYEGLKESQVILYVMKKIKPPRPSEMPGLTDSCWDLISYCWAMDSASRPTANRIALLLKQL